MSSEPNSEISPKKEVEKPAEDGVSFLSEREKRKIEKESKNFELLGKFLEESVDVVEGEEGGEGGKEGEDGGEDAAVSATKTTDDDLPVAYRDTTNEEEDVMCIIGPEFDHDGTPVLGKYVAMFQNLTTKEQRMARLEDLEHVDKFRNELVLVGWRMVRHPGVSWEQGKTTSKQQKKWLKKQDEKNRKRKEAQKKAIDMRKLRIDKELQKRKAFADALKKKVEVKVQAQTEPTNVVAAVSNSAPSL